MCSRREGVQTSSRHTANERAKDINIVTFYQIEIYEQNIVMRTKQIASDGVEFVQQENGNVGGND